MKFPRDKVEAGKIVSDKRWQELFTGENVSVCLYYFGPTIYKDLLKRLKFQNNSWAYSSNKKSGYLLGTSGIEYEQVT